MYYATKNPHIIHSVNYTKENMMSNVWKFQLPEDKNLCITSQITIHS